MKFLTKLGQIVLRCVEVVSGIGPVLTPLIPGDKDDKIVAVTTDTLLQVAGIIQEVEIFGQALNLPGPDKLKAAAPAVAQVILQSALMARHEIANPELFKAGCTKMADGMADVLNALKDKIETVNKT